MTEGDQPAGDGSDDGEEVASTAVADQSDADSPEAEVDARSPPDADGVPQTDADQADSGESEDVDSRVDTTEDSGSSDVDDHTDGSAADSSGSDTSAEADTQEAPDSPDAEAYDVSAITDTGADEATAHDADGAETGDIDSAETDVDSRADSTDADEFESAPAADAAGATGSGGATSGSGMATPAGAGAGGGGGGGGGGIGTGAPDDQEMPLTDHIEEMVKRLGIVVVVMAAISAVVFPFADRLINFLWYSFLPGTPSECAAAAIDAFGSTDGAATTSDAACPRLYHPLALLLARLKVASLTGFVVALPVFVYQTYLFMRPGLYPNERRYYLSSVPTSLLLAGIGLAFAHFLVLPVIFTYFLGYSQPVAEIAFGLADTFNLIVLMLGMFALIFQIPLFVMLAIMMGVTTRNWLEDRRLYFWAGFAGLAFLFSPDPTGMAPFIVAVTMIVLFEGTLLLLRWTGR